MWQMMTMDEYAALEKVTDSSIHSRNGVWWRRVRPFYYRSLLPFVPQKETLFLKKGSSLNVYQYPIAFEENADSYFNIVIYFKHDNYRLEDQVKSFRRAVKKAKKAELETRVITDGAAFAEQAHSVYLDSYKRTGFIFRKKWLDPLEFSNYAHALFKHKKLKVLGIYREKQLLSVELSALVDDVVVLKSAVNSDEALKYNASDLVLDYYWTQSSGRSDIRYLYDGYWSTPGINRFKLKRGAEAIAVPAKLTAKPWMMSSLRLASSNTYKRLKGMSPSELMNYDLS